MRLRRLNAIGLGMALGFLVTTWLPAAVPPEKDLPIRQKINDELNASLNKLVDREKYAKVYGLKYPIPQPAQTLAAVQRTADTEFERLAKEKHPDSWVDEEFNKIKGKFAQWKIGDLVLARLRDGKSYKERLRKVETTKILVGPNEIRKEDLETRSLLHVDPVLAAKAQHQERNKLKNRLMATRAAYVRELRITGEEAYFKRAGYIKVLGEWKSEYDFFEERITAERDEFTKLLLPALEHKHYYNAGFRQYNGEWYDPKEIAALANAEEEPEDNSPSALDRFGSKIKAIFIKEKKPADDGDPASSGAEGTDEEATPAETTAQKGDAIWAVLFVVVVIVVLAVVVGVVAQLTKKKR